MKHRESISDGHPLSEELGRAFHRVLVPIDSFGASREAVRVAARIANAVEGELRLVHIRIWDPPLPRGGGGRCYFESSEEATAVLDSALSRAWTYDVAASGIVVDASRAQMAGAILAEASRWEADVIVLTRRPRRFIGLGLWDRVSAQLLRETPCPTLLVPPASP